MTSPLRITLTVNGRPVTASAAGPPERAGRSQEEPGCRARLVPHGHARTQIRHDRAGVLTTPVYGEDNFLWASDFPHGVTTWPYSKETVDRNCAGIDPVIKKKINRENTAKLYGLVSS